MLSGLNNIVDNVFISSDIRIFYIILHIFINSFIVSLLYFKAEIETSEQKLRYQGKYRIIDDGDNTHYKCLFSRSLLSTVFTTRVFNFLFLFF